MVATGWVVVQSTWLKRELSIFKRVHFSGERESFKKSGEFKSAENFRGRGEVCPGYLPSAFRHPPMVVLTN